MNLIYKSVIEIALNQLRYSGRNCGKKLTKYIYRWRRVVFDRVPINFSFLFSIKGSLVNCQTWNFTRHVKPSVYFIIWNWESDAGHLFLPTQRAVASYSFKHYTKRQLPVKLYKKTASIMSGNSRKLVVYSTQAKTSATLQGIYTWRKINKDVVYI